MNRSKSLGLVALRSSDGRRAIASNARQLDTVWREGDAAAVIVFSIIKESGPIITGLVVSGASAPDLERSSDR